jgi:hypothetical protein
MLKGPHRFRLMLERVARARWQTGIALGVAVVVATFPFWAGALGAHLVRSKLSARIGVPVSVDKGRAGAGTVVLSRVVVGSPGRPSLLVADRVHLPFSAAWGRGTVVLEGTRIEVERGGPSDNLGPLLARLAGSGKSGARDQATAGGGGGAQRGPALSIKNAGLRARDNHRGAELQVGALDVELVPGERLTVAARQASGSIRVRGGDRDPNFGASDVRATVALAGLRPVGPPDVNIEDGYLQVLPTLGLTGIRGTVRPAQGGAGEIGASARRHTLVIDLAGSYGGARQSLWTATGEIEPPGERGPLELAVSLRAARFSLAKIKDILPPSVLQPADTSVDAALDLRFRDGRLAFKGNLDVTGLNLRHQKVAMEPVMGMNVGLVLDGAVEPARRRVELTLLEGRLRHLIARLSGAVELASGTFRFTDGTKMDMVPKIELQFEVPRLPCAKLHESIPGPIVPHLRGFVLQGNFEADIRAKIDYAMLDQLELGGRVGIGGCRVAKAPEEVTALGGPNSVVQIVEVPSAEKNALPGATELMAFALGPDNPDFVPYEEVSPHIVNSIMTTEDSGFFRHRGWVTPEFKSALRRNLAGGGFRLGASSITMQMVKNVLLSREKTLSRKLQELFLVWYIEQQLPKERILELYFNAIEFGPRLYGIGPAARHYFGKSASDITPLEAAFFSSILPSPKRRYIQYCHGQLYPPWEKYVRRILARVHERGRLTPEEYAAAAASTLTFDLTERKLSEQECLAWVRKITQRPAESAPPEGEN